MVYITKASLTAMAHVDDRRLGVSWPLNMTLLCQVVSLNHFCFEKSCYGLLLYIFISFQFMADILKCN